MSENKLMYCFLDTNILIHYQTFDEVKWTKVASASQVTFTVSRLAFENTCV
jgi:hypothetical protein